MMRPPQPNRPVNPDRMQKAPPGWSLTQPPKKWPWESPPRRTNPDEVVTSIVDKLELPELQDRYTKMMFAGISIEEIVQSIAMGGFMKGEFSVDVAELIKPPLAFYFLGLASENDIPAKLFADTSSFEEKDTGMDNQTILEVMRARNPELYDFLRMKEDEEIERAAMRTPAEPSGFLGARLSPETMLAEEATVDTPAPPMEMEEAPMDTPEGPEEEEIV